MASAQMSRKGIILAGGAGTRLRPLTTVTSKQMLPVYDKPMIYYPLSVLMLGGIRDLLLISTPRDVPMFRELLGDGAQWGISISYAIQSEPRGLAESLIIAENFLAGSKSALVLGDNVFYGHGLSELLIDAQQIERGAVVFGYRVSNPSDYGVIEFDANDKIVSIEEKPKVRKSDWAVTGLYFYDGDAPALAKTLKPSARNELEITDLNRAYLDAGKLTAIKMGRGFAWLDTGTSDSLLNAAEYVRTIEQRQGLKIACLEEIALLSGWISASQVAAIGNAMATTEYGRYLLRLVK
jgi:glucose-1-phosphate thymidylyltransferase